MRRPHHRRRADRVRPHQRPPLCARAPADADADRARRLRARDAAGRRQRLPVGRHQRGAVDARHRGDRDQHGRCRRLHRRQADRPHVEGQAAGGPEPAERPARVPGRARGLRARSQGSDDRARPGIRGQLPHPLRPPDQEAGAGPERAGREAAVHAPIVDEPDEPRAGRTQAERGRPESRRRAVREGARHRSRLRRRGLSPRPGPPAAAEARRGGGELSPRDRRSIRRMSTLAWNAPRC